jgi:DNA-binding transcriptional MocR family regulator
MHLVGWLPEGMSGANVSRRAAEQNLKFASVSAYSTGELPHDGFVLGYTAFDKKQIRSAVGKLKTLLIAEFSK